MCDMPRKLPLYVHRERDRHGRIRFYFRKGKGKRTALPAPNTDEFADAYQAALSDRPQRAIPAQSHTLGWLAIRYKESQRYAALAASTRRLRDNVLARAIEGAETVNIKAVTRAHIIQGIERRKTNAAAAFLQAMRQVFAFALEMGWIEADPTHGIKTPKEKSDGHHTWTIGEVEQFRNHWPIGSRERLALELLLFTGLRRSDLFTLGRQHVSDGALSVRTQKTGEWVYIPIQPALAECIKASPTGDLAFITKKNGEPFGSESSFGNWFREVCKSAGVPGRAHGLRKAGATIAAEDGATSHELMAMYGWSQLAQAEIYTKAASRKRLAVSVSERIENRFSPNLSSGSGMKAKK